MNDPEGFDALSPAEKAMLLEALRDHIKKLGPAARSNDDVANTLRMFRALARKLEAIVESKTRSLRPPQSLASASHKRGDNGPPKERSEAKKAKGKGRPRSTQSVSDDPGPATPSPPRGHSD